MHALCWLILCRCADAWMPSCRRSRKGTYSLLKRNYTVEGGVMKTRRRPIWARLTERQRAQVVAILVQMLLRQLAQQREGESS